MIVTKPLIFTILLIGIFGITEATHKRGKGRRIRPSAPAYQTQNLPIQQSHIPQKNYYTPTSSYSTTSAQRQPVRPVAPRPGIVVFGVGPHSLQIPNQYSNFPATPYSGQSIPQLPYTQVTKQNTAAKKPAPKPNPTISVATKPEAYQQNIEPAKSHNPVQNYAQSEKSPQYGNKLQASNPYRSPSPPAVPVVKAPENDPVYTPVKNTVYASAHTISDPYPAPNPYKEESSTYQTTTPSPASPTSKYSAYSSYTDTKVYPTTVTYYLKTTTKPEIKSYYSTPSPKVQVSESYVEKEESYSNTPVYTSPVKNTVYASAYAVSEPAISSYPAPNPYKEEESSSYQTTTPSAASPTSKYSSHTETKAYPTTETYSKTTTKPEIKSYYSTPSPKVQVSESYVEKEESYLNAPVYTSPVKNTVYPSSVYAVSDSANYPAPNPYTEEKTSSYQTTSPSPTSKSAYSSYTETKVYPTTETYYLKTTTKPEIKSYYSTPSPKFEVTESYAKKEESYSNTPVYTPPVKNTVYASSHVASDPANYPAPNIYTESSSYQTTTPSPASPTAKYSAYSSYTETKVYPTTETYLKTTTKPEIKSYYSTPSPKVEVSESYAKKEESYSKKEESYTKKEETYKKKSEESHTGDENKSMNPVYPEPQYHKNVEYLPVADKKKEDALSSLYSSPKYVASEESLKKNSHEIYSNVKESKQNTPSYSISLPETKPSTQSPRIYEEKKKLDAPVKYVDENETKGSDYSDEYFLFNKEIKSSSSTENKKKYDSPSVSYAGEQIPSSEPWKKNQNKESYVNESQLKTPVYSASHSYKDVEYLPKTEDKKQANVPDYVPTSKPYQPKSAPVAAKLSDSVKEVKSYSQPKSTEYSTESITTTQKYRIASQDRSKSDYSTTTAKYQEPTTYSPSSTLATSTQTQKGYTSSASYEKIPIVTTQGFSSNQYSTKAYVSYSSTASPNNDKSIDRAYVASGQLENVNAYQKPGPSSASQSYSNTGQDQSAYDRSSSAKPVLNEYESSIEKSFSSSKDYIKPVINTESKINYKARPVPSPADYLSTYNSKEVEKTDASKKLVANIAENYKTEGYGDTEKEGDYSAIPGEPGTDYPIFSELPNNQFNCSEQRLPGYYADVSARCQVFHICLGDRQWSFLCPNGTIFSQEHFVCVWWHEFDCSKATSLYELNKKLFVISTIEQTTDGESENKPYEKSTSEISKKSDKNYQSSKTKEESVFVAY